MLRINLRNLAEFLAILDKLEIQFNPNLTDLEKEVYKKAIDELKKQVR